jgi:trk system potassium uptake protein TrkA
MKIIILGAGQVGGTLAEHLADEKNDITVVDTDGERLRALKDRWTSAPSPAAPRTRTPPRCRCRGRGDAHRRHQQRRDQHDGLPGRAHLLPHATENLPGALPGLPGYEEQLFSPDHIPVDVIIGPEQLITDAIRQLIINPGALQVMDFAEGRAQLVAVRAVHGGPIVGKELSAIREHMPKVDTRVAAIFRRDRPIIPEGNTVVEANDEVFFIAAQAHPQVMSELRRIDKPYKRVMIAGGGNIGARLAQSLENEFSVKVIEFSHARCRVLSEVLKHTLVIEGSAAEPQLLTEENIEGTDVFCALTNNDESNIMMSMLAKRMGAKKVITLITNPPTRNWWVTRSTSPSHPRKSPSAACSPTCARAISAPCTPCAAEPPRPSRWSPGAMPIRRRWWDAASRRSPARGRHHRRRRARREVLIAHHDLLIESDDHVILFLVDKRKISAVEKLFTVGFGFFS